MDWEYALGRITSPLSAGTKASFWVVLPSELNAEYTDPTLMATRMVGGMRFADSGVTSSGGIAAIGLIAWDDVNDTPPAGSECPDPIDNGNLDWIIRQVFVAIASGNNTINPGDETITSKARRRLGTSRGILCVVSAGVAAPILNAVVDCRCLIKE